MDLTGRTAPDFTLPRDGGTTVTLSQTAGPVVLYFYPKDDTSGCTKQAIAFSAAADAFAGAGAGAGATILGVSRDGVEKHERFRDKHGLAIALLSDADGAACEAYGVWTEKKMYGKTFMGIERSTFLIGSDGVVVREWRKVKVPGHVDEVLAAVATLRA